jgi:hypothetical protein
MPEITEAQEQFSKRQGEIKPESQPTTTPEQTQAPLANQEQTKVSAQTPEKKGAFGFLDFFARMKGQKTAPPIATPPAAPVEQSAPVEPQVITSNNSPETPAATPEATVQTEISDSPNTQAPGNKF